jgi:hypothetical protein
MGPSTLTLARQSGSGIGGPAKSIASAKRKTSQARTLLAAVYRRGFDTADVVTAKTLLESFR